MQQIFVECLTLFLNLLPNFSHPSNNAYSFLTISSNVICTKAFPHLPKFPKCSPILLGLLSSFDWAFQGKNKQTKLSTVAQLVSASHYEEN